MKIEYFDSHAHYDDSKFDEDRKEIIQKMYNEGVTKIISAGYNLESSKYASKLTSEYDFIYTTCGISPNDIPEGEKEFYKELIERNKVKLNQNAKNIEKIAIVENYTVASKVKEMFKVLVKQKSFVFNKLFSIKKHNKQEVVTAFSGLYGAKLNERL